MPRLSDDVLLPPDDAAMAAYHPDLLTFGDEADLFCGLPPVEPLDLAAAAGPASAAGLLLAPGAHVADDTDPAADPAALLLLSDDDTDAEHDAPADADRDLSADDPDFFLDAPTKQPRGDSPESAIAFALADDTLPAYLAAVPPDLPVDQPLSAVAAARLFAPHHHPAPPLAATHAYTQPQPYPALHPAPHSPTPADNLIAAALAPSAHASPCFDSPAAPRVSPAKKSRTSPPTSDYVPLPRGLPSPSRSPPGAAAFDLHIRASAAVAAAITANRASHAQSPEHSLAPVSKPSSPSSSPNTQLRSVDGLDGIDEEKKLELASKSHTSRCRAKVNAKLAALLAVLPPPPANVPVKHKAQALRYVCSMIEATMARQSALEAELMLAHPARLDAWLRANVAGCNSARAALDPVLRLLMARTGWKCADAWMLDDRNHSASLRCSVSVVQAGRAQSDPLHRFVRASAPVRFTPTVGVPGRVYATRQPEWLTPIAPPPTFLRESVARDVGLTTCFAMPIVVRGSVMAVVAVYDTSEREYNSEVFEVSHKIVGAVNAALSDMPPMTGFVDDCRL